MLYVEALNKISLTFSFLNGPPQDNQHQDWSITCEITIRQIRKNERNEFDKICLISCYDFSSMASINGDLAQRNCGLIIHSQNYEL